VWTAEGSPLKIHVERQAKLLRGFLGQAGHRVVVDYAMRYGEPSIPATLSRLKAEGCTRILLLPLYPQYAASTTATAFDAAAPGCRAFATSRKYAPVRSFADHPGYIAALGSQCSRALGQPPGRPDRLVSPAHELSWAAALHAGQGRPLPLRVPEDRPPAGRGAGSGPEQYQICFQSRFGRAEWLQPYTAPTLQALGKQGVQRVDVICPGFPADCLETLEEIAIEGKPSSCAPAARSSYLPCLNERDDWIHALADIAANTCRAGRRRFHARSPPPGTQRPARTRPRRFVLTRSGSCCAAPSLNPHALARSCRLAAGKRRQAQSIASYSGRVRNSGYSALSDILSKMTAAWS
jgi:ferrochelatase